MSKCCISILVIFCTRYSDENQWNEFIETKIAVKKSQKVNFGVLCTKISKDERITTIHGYN